jgi:hypothetical protein
MDGWGKELVVIPTEGMIKEKMARKDRDLRGNNAPLPVRKRRGWDSNPRSPKENRFSKPAPYQARLPRLSAKDLIFRYLKSALAVSSRDTDAAERFYLRIPAITSLSEEPRALPKSWPGHHESSQLSKAKLHCHYRLLQSEAAYDLWMHLSEDPDLLACQQHVRPPARQQRPII